MIRYPFNNLSLTEVPPTECEDNAYRFGGGCNGVEAALSARELSFGDAGSESVAVTTDIVYATTTVIWSPSTYSNTSRTTTESTSSSWYSSSTSIASSNWATSSLNHTAQTIALLPYTSSFLSASNTSPSTSYSTTSSSSLTSVSPVTVEVEKSEVSTSISHTSSMASSIIPTSHPSSTTYSTTTEPSSSSSSSTPLGPSEPASTDVTTEDSKGHDDGGMITGIVVGIAVLLFAICTFCWVRRRARHRRQALKRNSGGYDGDGFLTFSNPSSTGFDRHRSFGSSITGSAMSFTGGPGINRVSLPASTFSTLACDTPRWSTLPPMGNLRLPTPTQGSRMNRMSVHSSTTREHPSPSPLSPGITSLLNANWPVVPPTQVVQDPEPDPAFRQLDVLADTRPGSESESEQLQRWTRSRILSVLVGELADQVQSSSTRQQAEDGGVRLAGGPPGAPSETTHQDAFVFGRQSVGGSLRSNRMLPPPYARYSEVSAYGADVEVPRDH
ncbi:hypothetical protein DAEQUDRAFT_770467 [Daedalea quercina L-15889]|uniref:Uncharacterized protein n=1 Tax=Daedalea quercina L-15889 TaxID=1314783 RepID=A0A165KUF0_9APHY|nr:hypothetical protein DAEQUDRAFT_770467 [Daedalea quercina L-15889]